MLKSVLLIAIVFGASTSSACLQARPNYSYKLSGKIELQENGQVYTACEVKDGYISLQHATTFRIHGVVIECNERMLGHNSVFLTLKNGKVSHQQDGFSGSYDTYNLLAKYSVTDADGTYTETDTLKFSNKCETLALNVEIKKSGSTNYYGRFNGEVAAKIAAP